MTRNRSPFLSTGECEFLTTSSQPGHPPDLRRRKPEATVLYKVMQEHFVTFLARADARAEADPGRGGLPRFVRRELEGFLSCGILARGFVRAYCAACRQSILVAFICKARAVCPSCTGRRMAEVAAHLVDHVLPEVPIRQWVLSLPHRVRYLMARHSDLCREVRGIFARAVQSFYCRRANAQGYPGGRCGAVVHNQRFDSAIRLDLHFHGLFLDGVYTGFDSRQPLTFVKATHLTDDEVESMVRHIRALIFGHLKRRGFLDEEAALVDESGQDHDELTTYHAAAVQGVIPFGPRSGQRALLFGEPPADPPRSREKKKLCADHEGYSLHAAIRVNEHQAQRLERLVRYVARPAFAKDRLSLARDGSIVYRFRKPWRNGKQAVVMDPMTFLSRLAAQVPPPRCHMLSYYGVLAPAASRRDEIVPGYTNDEAEPRQCAAATTEASVATASKPKRLRPERALWADLIKRVFLTDVLRCPCGGRRVVLSMVFNPASIERVLRHLGLPHQPPQRAPPRPLPAVLPFSVCDRGRADGQDGWSD